MPNYDFKKQPVLLIQGAMEQHKVIANPTVDSGSDGHGDGVSDRTA